MFFEDDRPINALAYTGHALLAPGDDGEADGSGDDDWSDIDDEDFEDMAEDRDDLYELELDENDPDDEDDDHLPDDDLQ